MLAYSYTGGMSEILEPTTLPRLTTTASGGGCACKIPPGELEAAVAQLAGQDHDHVIVGVDDGDDAAAVRLDGETAILSRSEEHTSELQSRFDLVCRLLLEKKKNTDTIVK